MNNSSCIPCCERVFHNKCLNCQPCIQFSFKELWVGHDILSVMTLPILQVNLITTHARCTQDRIDRLQQSTVKHDTLALLKHTVQHGWPQTITELPSELCPYWTFREEISIEDGILLKGEQIIIPAVDQPDNLQQLHHGHLGLQKCLHYARVSVYWQITKTQGALDHP